MLLGRHEAGRMAVVEAGFPMVVPVNFKMVSGDDDNVVFVVSTRHDGPLGRATRACLQIDAFDSYHREGWSVMVQATVEAGDAPPVDSWVAGRDLLLVLRPVTVAGRRLHAHPLDLPNLGAYL